MRRMPPPAMARAIREAAGVSQRAFAAELGVHRLTLVRWETGTHRPRGEMRSRYATLLAQIQDELNAA